MQVMKQLSANPSVDSTTKGWELLHNMVKVALPSVEVYEFLIAFVQREATPQSPETQEGDESTGKSSGGWKQAFFEVVRKQRQEQSEMNQESGSNLNMASVAERVKKQKSDAINQRKSMVERLAAREKRKSRAAAAEEREDGVQDKRKAFVAKQVELAGEVLRWLGGSGTGKK